MYTKHLLLGLEVEVWVGSAARGGAEMRGPVGVLERLRALILTGEYDPEERLIEEQLA